MMKASRKPFNPAPRAFTLIEILLVVGIISMITAVVLSFTTSAREKAYDAAVKREVGVLRTLMAREMSDTGSYANLKANGGGKGVGGACSVGAASNQLKGTYADNFKLACDVLIRAAGTNCPTNACLRFDYVASATNKFSIVAYLPYASRTAGANRFLCAGSNGNTSVSTGSSFNEPGCPNDTSL